MSKLFCCTLSLCLLIQTSMAGATENAYQKAEKSVSLKQWGSAQSLLESWLRKNPNDKDAIYLLARVLAWQSKYQESASRYDALLASKPNNADYLLGLAQIRFWQDQPKAAIPLLERAQSVAPKYEAVWDLLIRSHYAAHDMSTAEDTQRLAAKQFPQTDWQKLTPPAEQLNNSATGATKQSPTHISSSESKPSRTSPVDAPSKFDNRIYVGGSFESLNNGFKDWNNTSVGASHSFGLRDNIYGQLSTAERFAMRDESFMTGFNYSMSDRWTLNFEASESSTSHFLPKWSMLGGVHYKMDYGFGAMFSLHHSGYNETNNDVAAIGLENYWRNWRFSYTLYISQLKDAARPVMSHVGQVAYHYSDRDFIGVSIGGGQQSIRIDSNTITNSDTQTYSLQGNHWLMPDLAITYDASINVQGSSYTRHGIALGLQYAF